MAGSGASCAAIHASCDAAGGELDGPDTKAAADSGSPAPLVAWPIV